MFLSQLIKHVAANNVINGKIVFRIMLLVLFLQIYENKRTKDGSFRAISVNAGFCASYWSIFLENRSRIFTDILFLHLLRICPVIAYKKKMCIFV